MSNDGSLGSYKQMAFDLDSQKGVTLLLASVRASDISPAHKNELRDLIFLYTNGGRDQSVRITLEQKISSYGVEPIALEPLAKPEPVATPEPAASAFGASRPAPSFSAPVVSKPDAAASVADAAPAASPVPETQAPAVAPVPPPPVAETVAAPVAEVPPPTPQTAPAPEPAVTEAPTPTPVPVTPPPAQAAEAAPAGDYDPNRNLQRIREIKSLVNDRVGNPVNLVDINNEVGREYMAALLDAMKKLNNGSSVISAMKRLETAYLAVDQTLKEHESSLPKETAVVSPVVPTPPAAPVIPPSPPTPLPAEEPPAPVVEPEVQPQPEAPAIPIPDTPVAPAVTEAPVIPEPVIVPEASVAPVASETEASAVPGNLPTMPAPPAAPAEETEVPVEAEVVSASSEAPETEKVPVRQPIKIVREDKSEKEPVAAETPAPTPQPQTASESAWGPATDTLREASRSGSVAGGTRFASLAQAEVKPRTLADLPSASAIETSSVEGDSLFTKEIDTGLDQLLQEWSLFRKSGLFGTGPKGREHPLFKKVAGLQIPLLLAGRFEGATQEIKQSITDYMNGWRYEQGIIYNQGETFEHYLRRVIRHILDLQK